MNGLTSRGHSIAWRRSLGHRRDRAQERVLAAVGGRAHGRVILLLALVLALSSADTAAVGAAAGPLKRALHINFTQIGLLAALPSLAGAAATVPVGALSDRVHRVSLLRWSVVAWSLAMIAAGASTSFEMLLLSRLAIGVVTATSGPTLASLTGDFFSPSERGRIYGFILTGDLIGSVSGLFFSGNVAAVSWRLAFWVLAIPSAGLAGRWGGICLSRLGAAPTACTPAAPTSRPGRPARSPDTTSGPRTLRRRPWRRNSSGPGRDSVRRT